ARHEDWHFQFPCQSGESRDVIGVFVRDQDCGNVARIAAYRFQSLESLAARDTRIHQNARAGAFDKSSVSPAAARQHRNRNSHVRSIHLMAVNLGVTLWLSETFRSGSRSP